MHDPRESQFSALKRILRYVRGTLDHGLQLFSSSTSSLVAYSDADWTGCPTTRRSTSGYCVFLGNNLLSYSSKHQPTLSLSSAEAKYRGVVNAVAETCFVFELPPSANLFHNLTGDMTREKKMGCGFCIIITKRAKDARNINASRRKVKPGRKPVQVDSPSSDIELNGNQINPPNRSV
ncbi:ribonuclease H-like domain-containing protein [Tanacetum coccineum]